MATLFGSPIGVLALGVSLVMAVVGFVWLRRIMTIEV
jgi:Flp pilus assembly protein TadB